MEDPRLQHVSRQPAARGRAPGWRLAPPGAAVRLFSDRDHGSPGAALDAALAFRDRRDPPHAAVPIPAERVTLAPGISLLAHRRGPHTYPVVRAAATTAEGRTASIVRSLVKHAPERALRDAAEHRFRHRQGRPGFPYTSPDALYADALAAFRAHLDSKAAERS